MKITQQEIVDRQTVLHIELEEEDLSEYLDRGYRRLVTRADIPGFRKGKAPRAIIERYLGRESLLHEAVDFMLPDATQRAISAQELDAAGTPSVELLELEPVTVKATVALAPEVDLGQYRDIRVEETKKDVSEEDVQERLEALRKAARSWEPVERPVRLNDMVTMDVAGTLEDRKLLDEKKAVHVADPESALPFPGFSQHLEGIVVGEPAEFDLTVPSNYGDTSLAGKQVHFTLAVSDVKEQKLPDLDDEFAKGVGEGYDDLGALREAVTGELQVEAERAQLEQYREAVLGELLKGATVTLPPLLVEHEVEHMAARRDSFVDKLNIRMDDYLRYTGKTEEQAKTELEKRAAEQLSHLYALEALAKREGLEVSEEEIDERVQSLMASGEEQAEGPSRDLNSDDIRGSIRQTLIMGKALDRLAATARGEVEDQSSEEGDDDVDTQA